MKKKIIKKIKKVAAKKLGKKSVKKIVQKNIKKPAGKLVGKITHYFSNIRVGVIKLSGPLRVSESVRIIGGESTDFNQKIISMQVDLKPVKIAKKGKSVGIKVKEKVREGYKVYKI